MASNNNNSRRPKKAECRQSSIHVVFTLKDLRWWLEKDYYPSCWDLAHIIFKEYVTNNVSYFLCINMLKLCTQISLDLRTFLSDAYKCDAEWKSRLNNPLLQKLRNGKIFYLLSHLPVCLSIFYFFLENFYGEILKKFQKEGKVSPIDVDLVRNLFKHTYLKK